jgi:hypothetical protein
MKKVVIDSKLYTIKNKEFEELERLLTVLQLALSDEDIIPFFAYINYCKDIVLKYGEGKHIDGVYSTNG